MACEHYTDDLPHLRRGERIASGLTRVVRECCEHALQRNARTPNDEAVHEARRALKRARAVLRLREDMGAAVARGARKRLSVIARELSPRRDATIAAKVARQLAAKLNGTASENEAPRGAKRENAAWWAGWQQKLAAELPRLASVVCGEPTRDEVRSTLHKSAKRVRKRARQASAKGDIASAHEWRKAVIVLREQVLVVRPLLTQKKATARGKLDALAQRLGKAKDYNVLKQAVALDGSGLAMGRRKAARFEKAAKKRGTRAMRQARKRWAKVRRVLRKKF